MPRLLSGAAAILCLTFSLGSVAHAQAGPPGKTATARALLVAMRAESMFVEGLESSIPTQKQQAPQLPAVFWDRILARAKSAAPSFLDSLAPIYANQFSEPELQQLIQFYQSPIGTRLTESQGTLMLATQQLGYRWGVRIGSDVAKELADEGLLK